MTRSIRPILNNRGREREKAMPDFTAFDYKKGNNDHQILLDWDNNRLVVSANPKVMNLLSQRGISNPRGYKVGEIARLIAGILFPGNRRVQRAFLVQALTTKNDFQENGALGEVSYSIPYAYEDIYYKIKMAMFVPPFDRFTNFKRVASCPVIMSIFPEWISAEHYNEMQPTLPNILELQRYAQKFIAEYQDDLIIIFHWEDRRPILATERMQGLLGKYLERPMVMYTGRELALHLALRLYPDSDEMRNRFLTQMADAEENFEQNSALDSGETYHAYKHINEKGIRYFGVRMFFTRARSDTGSLSASLVILHIKPKGISAEEYERRVRSDKQFVAVF
jgi:hypothetical protein